jgi:hypothetical protein
MNIDEACALLDPRNPYSESLAQAFRFLHGRDPIVIERKGMNLIEMVRKLKDRKLYPIVDKKLGLVFGSAEGHHDYLRTELFRYYYHAEDPSFELPHTDPFESQDRYISEGHGWFISSMRPDVIIAGRKYRPDSPDKDLFMMYRIESSDED